MIRIATVVLLEPMTSGIARPARVASPDAFKFELTEAASVVGSDVGTSPFLGCGGGCIWGLPWGFNGEFAVLGGPECGSAARECCSPG